MPEDAKGQAVSAFRRIGLVLRAVVYGGLGLGLSATIGFFGLHLWVEHLQLPRPAAHESIKEEDRWYGWDDQIEGWSGAHLGKGTDPRLGWRIRALIRAAWVAENWQSGQLAVDADQPDHHHLTDGRLIDSAYAISQSRLQQAILMAKEAGLTLENRSLFELQLRLAHICQRINTPTSLLKSYEIYSQLWTSCVDSIDRFDPPGQTSKDWQVRQSHSDCRSSGTNRVQDCRSGTTSRWISRDLPSTSRRKLSGLGGHSGLGLNPALNTLQDCNPSLNLKPQNLRSGQPCSANWIDKRQVCFQTRALASDDLLSSGPLCSSGLSGHAKGPCDPGSDRSIRELGHQTQEDQSSHSADARLHYHWLRSRALYRRLERDVGSSDVFQPGLIRSWSGRLSEPLESLRRDVRFTASMASTFLGLKYESCPSKSSLLKSAHLQSSFDWCYLPQSDHQAAQTGCQVAKLFFQRAVDYSLGSADPKARHHQPLVLLEPLNENLNHLSRIENLSENS
ncbi:hypothetical protein PGT21_025450 [Puccinia graminis f. sp. tritici]|uniref:Uncharacterized protein n=1 Tax=Puccinia graminis f. sp. tritici TaxID=56615 RepID=A0A5B0NF66_PUCGR|nr:hypothetical protein PGT21_025450 [Puccinia graminis f. sp. tritici]